MTLEETRQLGIEFERRVQTMIPEKEYLDKLDTDTIYAYLNSYQDKYIHDIYRNLDLIKSGSKLSAHVEAILQEMLKTLTILVENAKDYTGDIQDENGIVIIENGRSVTYPLDPSFYMYIRSVSNVSSTYSYKNNGDNIPIRVLPNELVSQSDIWRLLETPHNSLRILRHPAAAIGAYEEFLIGQEPLYTISGSRVNPPFVASKKYTAEEICNKIIAYNSSLDPHSILPGDNEWPTVVGDTYDFMLDTYQYTITVSSDTKPVYKNFPTLNVIYDRYTNPEGIKIVYYSQPRHFDIMTNTTCELPMDAFDDLVTGAVDLYVQYVAGAEANKRRILEALRLQAKLNRKDNEDEE